MAQNSTPNERSTNQSEDRSLEQRIIAVEEQNRELKRKLNQQQKSGLPNVSRRQTLAGLLGGGALLGATGSASAQPGKGKGHGHGKGKTTGGNGKPFKWEDTDNDSLLEVPDFDGIDVSTVNAGKMSVTNGSFETLYTHSIINRDGIYYAIDDQGNIVATDSTPDVGALINSIAPPAIKSYDQRSNLMIALEPNQIFDFATGIVINNGTRFALHGGGLAGSTLKWTGDMSTICLHYAGDSSFHTVGIGSDNNRISLRNFELTWSERDTDIIRVTDGNELRAEGLLLRDRRFDLRDRIKQKQDTAIVPSGDWTAFADINSGVSELRRISDIWVVGASRGFYLRGDHLLGHNLQAFYCNPPSDKGVYTIGFGGGGNDRTLMNCHVYESSAYGFVITSGAGYPNMLINCVSEDQPPNGYNAQQGFLYNISGSNAIVAGYAFENVPDSLPAFSGDVSQTAVISHDTIATATKMQYPALSAPPTNPTVGDVAIADGTNWDPDGDGNAEKVVFNGTSWVEDTDLDTAL